MCGICGFVGTGDRADLEAMTAGLAHRGPDAAGYWIEPVLQLFIGHRRLAILDIEGGGQPMFDAGGRIGVVSNGEIYNHLELRRLLQARGYRFRTDHSDTEVLVHGFAEWGEDLPRRLNGMFAFAVYDRDRNLLFLARDRFGEKPLYYRATSDGLVFASELTALRRHPAARTSISRGALKKLFAYGFLPAPTTLYDGIHKLPAGTCLTYHLGERRLAERTYWRFAIEPEEPRGSDAELAEELRELLSEAVRLRLMSDVPLGIFLSGGIDSSTILAMAARHRAPADIDTFAIGFEEPSYDESPFARKMADFVGSRHHVDVLKLDAARSLVPHVLSRLDEPIADPSILPTWLLSRFTRQSVTVALSGDGGDELFAGYDPFGALRLAVWYQRLVPEPLHRCLRRLADLMPRSSANMSIDFKIRRGLGGMSYTRECWNPVWLGPLDPGEIGELFRERVTPEEIYSEAIAAWRGATSPDLVDRTLEFYTRFYLSENILTKADRASMMHSLELRAPFLDNHVVEFVRRLPSRYKLRGRTRKYLLKQAVAPLLPRDITVRPKKGFGIPLSEWMRTLASPSTEVGIPFIDAGFRSQRLRAHADGRADHRLFLWCCEVLQYHLKPESARAR